MIGAPPPVTDISAPSIRPDRVASSTVRLVATNLFVIVRLNSIDNSDKFSRTNEDTMSLQSLLEGHVFEFEESHRFQRDLYGRSISEMCLRDLITNSNDIQ